MSALAALWSEPRARAGVLGLGLLSGASALLPPLLTALGADPDTPRAGAVLLRPSVEHLLGTDELGRDVLCRLFLGGRLSLLLAALTACTVLVLGGTVGLLAGFLGGRVDRVLSRLIDLASAPPRVPLMLILLAVDLPSLTGVAALGGARGIVLKLALVIALFSWTTVARVARLEGRRLAQAGYVAAARALGRSPLAILWVHVLPNAGPALLAAAAVEVAEVVVYESALSFLGLGLPPPAPSWGAMLARGLGYLHSAPWLLVAPGLMSFAAAWSALLLGEGLGRALAPAGRSGLRDRARSVMSGEPSG